MDRRDYEAMREPWFKTVNRHKMTATVVCDDGESEPIEVDLPITFEVCGLCDGRGSHVNPSIDAHGISPEEFDEDPDFAESYFSGMYDEGCYRCGGDRVEPVINESNLNEEQKRAVAWLNFVEQDNYNYARECEAERRFGC